MPANAPRPTLSAPTPFERLCAAALLGLAAPAILLIGAAIRAGDGGPAIVRRQRLDAHGRTIVVRRFRTHRNRAGGGAATLASHDVTTVGRFLERAALDDLPLLISVVRGEHPWFLPRPERHAAQRPWRTGPRRTQGSPAARPPAP